MPAKLITDVEQTISVKQFMAHLEIKSATTVYTWIRKRYIKTAKIGKRRRIPVSEVARITKEGTRYGL